MRFRIRALEGRADLRAKEPQALQVKTVGSDAKLDSWEARGEKEVKRR